MCHDLMEAMLWHPHHLSSPIQMYCQFQSTFKNNGFEESALPINRDMGYTMDEKKWDYDSIQQGTAQFESICCDEFLVVIFHTYSNGNDQPMYPLPFVQQSKSWLPENILSLCSSLQDQISHLVQKVLCKRKEWKHLDSFRKLFICISIYKQDCVQLNSFSLNQSLYPPLFNIDKI